MFIFKNKKIDQGAKLYNKILSLSRNNIFYTKFQLSDSFQNRIILIFFHTAFLLVKFKIMSRDKSYKKFSQDMFDLMFKEGLTENCDVFKVAELLEYFLPATYFGNPLA